jgi:hypothetical protein
MTPASGCSLVAAWPSTCCIGRLQVLDKLLGEDIDILVAGDSMMRQLYTRLVQLLRGRRRVFDYRVRKHAGFGTPSSLMASGVQLSDGQRCAAVMTHTRS